MCNMFTQLWNHHHNINIGHFHHSKKKNVICLRSHFLSPHAQATINKLCVSISPFGHCIITESCNTWFFYNWLFSQSMFLSFLPALHCWITFYDMDKALFFLTIYHSMDILVVSIFAAMNIAISDFVWI